MFCQTVCRLFLVLCATAILRGSGASPEARLAYPRVPDCFPAARSKTYAAIWIRHKEPDPPNDSHRFFRKSFDLKKPLRQASFHCMFDDGLNFWVNGKHYHPTFGYGAEKIDVTADLKQGSNLIAADLFNGTSESGLLVRLELIYEDGSVENIVSELDWKSSAKAAEGWHLLGFDDSAWSSVIAAGDGVNSAPWYKFIKDPTPMLTAEDLVKYKRIQKAALERREAIARRLSAEKPEKVSLFYRKGYPWVRIGSRSFPALMYQTPYWHFDSAQFIEQVFGFQEADFRLYGTGVTFNELWTAPGKLDEAKLLEKLGRALNLVPGGYFMLDIEMWAPRWWLKANPDELVGYGTRPVDWNSNKTLFNSPAASYASEKWHRDAGEILRRIVETVERSPYASRIWAYRLDSGVHYEWHYYGMAQDMPDTGVVMTQRFRAFLRERYRGDVAALKKAWNDPAVTFDNAQVPGSELRQHMGTLSMRNAKDDRAVIDYLALHGKLTADSPLFFDRIAKKACNGRALVGNFYGYYYGMAFPAEGWHLETDRYLRDPAVDFTASPYAYAHFFRRPGGSGIPRTFTESFRICGKQATFLEADTGTHLSVNYDSQHSTDAESAVKLLTRDFAQALIRGAALWYFDFGNCWYDDPVLLAFFRKLQPILKNAGDCSSVSKVAVVGDYAGVPYQTNSAGSNALPFLAIKRNAHELGYSGAMFDTILFEDLDRPGADHYQVYIFPNSFYMTETRLKTIGKLRKAGKTLVWIYAPGVQSPEGFDLAQMARTSNMKVGAVMEKHRLSTTLRKGNRKMEPSDKTPIGPVFCVEDPCAEVLGTMKLNGKELVTFAAKPSGFGGKDILCTTVVIDRFAWYDLLKEAGIHLYLKGGAMSVLANQDYVALTSAKGGECRVSMPEKIQGVLQLLPEEKELRVSRTGYAFYCAVPEGGTVLVRVRR